jgi:transcriptional regulator with XRE-family HTH domain
VAGDDVIQTLAATGPRLRVARECRGVTLADVSRATGISPSTLSRIETGRRNPTLEVVLRLAKVYAVSRTSPETPVRWNVRLRPSSDASAVGSTAQPRAGHRARESRR